MTSHYRHRRTSNSAAVFNQLEPGEIAVNTANRQLAAGDAASASIGAPLPLLAVQIWDARAQYVTNDFVTNAGVFYRAKYSVMPGAFNAADWEKYSDDAAITEYIDGTTTGKVNRAGDTMAGPLVMAADPVNDLEPATKQFSEAGDADVTAAFTAADTVIKGNYLPKSGGILSGPLTLAADPQGALGAATKQYVDAHPTGIAEAPIDSRVYGRINATWSDISSTFESLAAVDVTLAAADAANAKAITDGLRLKVDKAGDVMTGNLTATSFLAKATPTTGAIYFGNFGQYLYNNGGGFVLNGGSGLSINGDLTVTRANPTTGAIYFGNSGQKYLWYDGTGFVFAGGAVNVAGNVNAPNITASGQVTSGQNFQSTGANAVLAGNGGAIYLRPNNASSGTGEFVVANNGGLTVNNDISLLKGSFVPPNGGEGGLRCKAGDAMAVQGNYVNFGWGGQYINLYVDRTFLGGISTVNSDYRIKKDIEPLPGMWDRVKALRPIKYTNKDFTPPLQAEQNKKDGVTEPFFKGSDEERWGFVAHELQSTLIKDAASGEKDMPNGIQSVNTFAIIAALTKALQEAMTRIEALETAGAAAQG
jgi:hypothetical protein